MFEKGLEGFASKNDVHGAVLPICVQLFAPGAAEFRPGGPGPTIPQTAVLEESEPDRIVERKGVLDDEFRDVPNRLWFGSLRNIIC